MEVDLYACERIAKAFTPLIRQNNWPSTILFFDLETTGLSVTKDKIVQIGYIAVNTENCTCIEQNILVNPECPIPAEATAVHKITDAMVAGQTSFKAIAAALYNVFSKSIVIGFNSNKFDVLLLSEEFNRCGYRWPIKSSVLFDVYEVEHAYFQRNLVALYKKYTGKNYSEDAHNAVNDVKATIEVFSGQLTAIEDSLSEIIDTVNEDRVDLAGHLKLKDGVICYNFGKHFGKPVASDLSYARWMLTQDFPTETKQRISEILLDDVTKAI